MAKCDSQSADKFGYSNMRGNSIRNVGKPTRGSDGMTFSVPSFTTEERDALDASNGMIIYNLTLNKIQGYENGSWTNLI